MWQAPVNGKCDDFTTKCSMSHTLEYSKTCVMRPLCWETNHSYVELILNYIEPLIRDHLSYQANCFIGYSETCLIWYIETCLVRYSETALSGHPHWFTPGWPYILSRHYFSLIGGAHSSCWLSMQSQLKLQIQDLTCLLVAITSSSGNLWSSKKYIDN